MLDFGSDDFNRIDELKPGDIVQWFSTKKRIALILAIFKIANTTISDHDVIWYKIYFVENNPYRNTVGCKELQSDHMVKLLSTTLCLNLWRS